MVSRLAKRFPSGRRIRPQERLKQALNVRGLEEVQPSHHPGDALGGVVHHHGQMIGDADVLARQDHIARPPRVGWCLAEGLVDEGQLLKAAQSALCGGDG